MSRAASQLGDVESLRGNDSGSAIINEHSVCESSQASRGPHFRDSSGPLFSMYSKIAEEEDNKMVDRWRKEAEGVLIFAGLFSAVVASLLSVTVPDLKPNPQANSEFYLKNICQSLSHENDSCQPPFPPPANASTFSPPNSSIWVNSLWILSVLVSLTCAMLATLIQEWARRYIRITQLSPRYSPHKRARLRAFFSDGVDKWHVSWAIEALPTLLHISLFLFFIGILIYLFTTNHIVFGNVVWWAVLSIVAYLTITLLPILRPNCPYYAPLSSPIWYLYATIRYTAFKVLSSPAVRSVHVQTADRFRRSNASESHCNQLVESIGNTAERVTEEIVLKRSSEIDIRILDWTISALGDEDTVTLESLFEAIPGFFNSRIVERPEGGSTEELFQKFRNTLDEFLDRTWSSNSVSNVDKLRRLDISMNAMNCIRASEVSSILHNILFKYWEEVPRTVEVGQTLARWCTSDDRRTSQYAQSIIALILGHVRDFDDSWVALTIHTYGIPESDLRVNIALGGDSALLTILIQVTRLFIRSDFIVSDVVEMFSGMFSKLDIFKTLPRQQHDFCTLWNEIVQEARNRESPKIPLRILRMIRHLYMKLHQHTDAAPTAFSPSTSHLNPILYHVEAYPLCRIISHHPDSNSHSCTHSRQSDNANVIIEPPSPTGQTDSQAPATMGSALQSRLPFLHAPFASRGAGRASRAPTSDSPLSTPSSVYFSDPASHPPSRVSPQQSAQSIALISNAPRSYPTSSALISRFSARGLVNVGNTSLVNAVLQLLGYSPPFRNMFRELDELKRRRGAEGEETGGYVTPLVDATVRFLKEFASKEETPPAGQPPQQGEGRTSGQDEEKGKEKNVVDSFKPNYLYDAMNEKSQLKDLLDGEDKDAKVFLDLYLAALDEELLPQPASISDYRSADHSIDSPISRIFRGTSCSTMDAPDRLDSVTVDDWRSLQLDIQSDSIQSVQDALVHISWPQQSVQVGPTGPSEPSQQVLIQDLPPILVLHFKRFIYDAAAGCTIKINKPIQFAPELEIPLDITVPAARQSAKPSFYTLYGVLYHHGMTSGGGHYSVDVLHPCGDGGNGEAWLHIDDESVSKVGHEDVFRGPEDERAVDQSAYMLFYRHTSP